MYHDLNVQFMVQNALYHTYAIVVRNLVINCLIDDLMKI